MIKATGFVQARLITDAISKDGYVATWSTLTVKSIIVANVGIAWWVTKSIAYPFKLAVVRAITIAIIEPAWFVEALWVTGLITE